MTDDITIYHNPKCGTSRNTLALIRHCGIEPTVIEYLKTPPSRAELQALIARMDCPVREVLRQKGTPYEELGLGEADVPFEALQDPYGITFWPNFKGRDGCRTPMPWTEGALAGFTTGKPWLPIPAGQLSLTNGRSLFEGRPMNCQRARNTLASSLSVLAVSHFESQQKDTPERSAVFLNISS